MAKECKTCRDIQSSDNHFGCKHDWKNFEIAFINAEECVVRFVCHECKSFKQEIYKLNN